MPRDASGNYTLDPSNPVVAGQPIEAAWANDTLDDIATAITDSLSRNGDGGMLAPLELDDGTVLIPGLVFLSEPTSGAYYLAAGRIGFSILATKVFEINANGIADVNFKDYSEQRQAVAAAATTAIDYSAGQVVDLSQDTNITTFSISNPPASGKAGAVTIIRTKDNNATPRTIAWPASVKWMNSTAPSLTTTANGVDIINLLTTDGGTTWYGTYATNFA